MLIYLILFLGISGQTDTFYYDFQNLQPYQTGEYTVSNQAVITDGHVELISSNDWHLSGWAFRYSFNVENNSSSSYVHYPVMLDLSMFPSELFDLAQKNGADLRIVDPDGNEVTSVWLEHYDFISETGFLWFKVQQIQPGTNTFYLYFGNASAQFTGDWDKVFKYLSPVAGAYWPYPENSNLSVYTFDDMLWLQVGDSTPIVNLNADESATVNTPSGIIVANGQYSIGADGDGMDIPVPFSFAGQNFAFPAVRDSDEFFAYCPYGTADATLYSGNQPVQTFTVSDSSPVHIIYDIPDNRTFQIKANRPVVIAHRTTELYDAYSMVPASYELWGVATGGAYLSALENNTEATVYYSDGTSHSYTLDATNYVSIGSGSLGSGNAIHIVANKPVGAVSAADGNGGETIVFVPSKLMSSEYILPRSGDYLVLATLDPATVCSVSTKEGTELTTETSTAFAPLFPGRIYFNSSYLAAGNVLKCDGLVVPYLNDAVLGDERNLLSFKDHRPFQWPVPEINQITQSSETSFYAQGPESVETPVFHVPFIMTEWTGIDFYSPFDVPPGTDLRFQISLDEGQNWIYYNGDAWVTAHDQTETSSAAMLKYAFPLLPAASSIKLRAYLSGNGTSTPVLGPVGITYEYEEGVDSFKIGTIDSPQVQNEPFVVTVEALDEYGNTLLGYDAPIILTASDGVRITPTTSPAFVYGKTAFYVTVLDATPEVTLTISNGSVTADSNPFEVTPAEISDLIKVSGDNQWGTVGEPLEHQLKVKLEGASGNGVAYQKIQWEITEGSGSFEENHTNILQETDVHGISSVSFIPGEGKNVISASFGNMEINFTIRGDLSADERIRVGAKGTTACNSSPGKSSPNLLFIILFALAFSSLLKRKSFKTN